MDEKDWLILQTIFEEKNITRASKRLFVSQPAVTNRINQLEKEFNIKLMTRDRKGVKFTPEGKYLVQIAYDMTAYLRKVKDDVQNMSGTVQGTLNIGVSSNFARYRLPAILKQFLSLYPDIQVNVSSGWSSDIINSINSGKVDIGIVRGNYNWQGPKVLISEETLCVIASKPIDLNNLPQHHRIYFQTDPLLDQEIDEWWRHHFSQPPHITMEVDKVETCIEMVLHGLGYAVVPSIHLQEDNDLHTYDLYIDHHKLNRKTWLICREIDLELSIVQAFVNFMKQYI